MPAKPEKRDRTLDELGGRKHFNHFPSVWAHAENPVKLRQLQDLWWVDAAKYSVLPLDSRSTVRFNSELMGRPTIGGDAKKLTFYPGQVGLPEVASPRTLNKSWTITADLTLPEKAEGMVVTQGGLKSGYGLTVSRHLLTT